MLSLIFGLTVEQMLAGGGTLVAAVLGSSVLTAWITTRSQRTLLVAQARGEDADAAAVIVSASSEFVRNVVERVTLLEQKVQHLEQNQARLVKQLVAAGIEPDLIPMHQQPPT